MNQASPRRSIQEEAHAWFVRLRSDQAGEADRGAFADWLAANPEHARAYAQAERLWQWLEAPGRLAHGRSVARFRRIRSLLRAVVGLSLAACLLLAGRPWVAKGLRPWRSDFVTGWGETKDIVLADGSHVTLNSHSGLDLAFDGKRRGVRLTEGEAYFEVIKDAARPFFVAAQHGEVTVLGTLFNVYDEGARVTVTVAEGRVRVAAGGEAVLSAGRQTAYSTAGVGPVSVGNADEALAWRRGRLVFKLQPLAVAIETINRHSRGIIVIVGLEIRDRVVSGVFNADQPEQSLQTIQATLQLSATRLPGGITLL